MQDDSATPEDRALWDDINEGKVPAEFGGGAKDQYFSIIDKSGQAYETPAEARAARASAGAAAAEARAAAAAARASAGVRADFCAGVYSCVSARITCARVRAPRQIFLRVYDQGPDTCWEGRP